MSSSGTTPALEVKSLSVSLPVAGHAHRVVTDVGFSIAPGEIVGLLGESGSGKSMTASALLGLAPGPAGHIEAAELRLGERDLLALDERGWRRVRGRDIAMIFQEPLSALDPVFTVGWQLTEVIGRHQRVGHRARKRLAARLLADVGLPDPERLLGRYPHELSGGMRQRVLIAMALSCAPSVLVADEPTSALDVTTQIQILDLLERQVRSSGIAVLLVTHDLAVIRRVCDRALVMQGGKIVEHGPAERLLCHPAHPYTAALLEATPRVARQEPAVDPFGPGPQARRGSQPLFEVRDLRVDYPAPRGARLQAVRGVSFELRSGSILAIVGESGCGKTSLARAMLGLVKPAGGSLRFRGCDLTAMSTRDRRAMRRAVQHVFQDPATALSPRRTIWQTLAEPLALYELALRSEWTGRMQRVLDTVGLDSAVLRRFPHQLSGGQRQRIALARALIADPAMIVADEPMSSLDVRARTRIIELLHRVRDETGIAFVLIAHDLSVVQQLADDICVMYLGGIVERAPATELFAAPAHPYTQALLAATAGRRGHARDNACLRGEAPSPLTPPPGCVFHTRCPHVTDRCRNEAPRQSPIRPVGGEPGAHQVRCHLWS